MRLLYLCCDPGIPVLGQKGASVHVREVASALRQIGTDVVIASPRCEPAGETLDVAIPLLPLSLVRHAATEVDLRAALEAQRSEVLAAARSFGADAIYERYSLFASAGVEVAASLGIPHVLEVNAPLREEASMFRSLPHPELAKAIERDVFRKTDRILVVSRALRRWLEGEGVAADRIEVVPNAVAPERFGQPRRSRDEFVLGFCGSLKAWHGLGVLLEACAIAFSEEPSLRLEVVGNGPLRHLLDVAALPAGRLTVLGPLPHGQAIERLCGWDVGVAPYLSFPGFYFSPLKVVEYMAAGACPVVSDVGDLPVLLSGGRGVVVPAGDARRLAAVLLELARDRERAAEMGRRARAYVLQTHTWVGNARIVLASCQRSRRLVA